MMMKMIEGSDGKTGITQLYTTFRLWRLHFRRMHMSFNALSTTDCSALHIIKYSVNRQSEADQKLQKAMNPRKDQSNFHIIILMKFPEL